MMHEGYGAGAPAGLQNQYRGKRLMEATVVGSIPTTPLQKDYLMDVFTEFKFKEESKLAFPA